MEVLKKQKGFTLVELLVVLAIIGILIGLAIAGIRIVQQVNRDTQRKAFTRDIQLILEAHQEKKNEYPKTITVTSGGGGCAATEAYIDTGVEDMCSKVNFDDLVVTSEAGACSGFTGWEEKSGSLTLCYEGDAKGYKMLVKLERSTDPYNASNIEL